jgi:5-formyltetrahydrofolate cyclo-ligase
MDTRTLRQQLRKQRRALSAAEQANAGRQLNIQLQSLDVVRQAKLIGLYLVNDGEIDPEYFMQWALERSKHCYLPILNQRGEPMSFGEYNQGTILEINRFNIPEPVVPKHARMNASELNLILMPLVAFDGNGNRIGMGGGFYDRTLAFKRQHPYHQRPVLIGLAHEFQAVDKIEPAAWDIPLDGIATEKQTIMFNPNSN